MQFTTVSVALMGLIAITSAAPHAQSVSPVAVRDLDDLVARGLTYIPKRANKGQQNKNKNKNSIQIVDTTFEQITEVQQGNEIELTTLVVQKITEESQKKTAKDNIRKNHFSAKNKNVNTVITVFTEIIDARSNEQVTRIMTHQLTANNGAKENVEVQVTEIKQITITSNDATKASQNSAAQASASAGASLRQIASNAPFLASNATIMLPPGSAAPPSNSTEFDPAAILEEEQVTMFVSIS